MERFCYLALFVPYLLIMSCNETNFASSADLKDKTVYEEFSAELETTTFEPQQLEIPTTPTITKQLTMINPIDDVVEEFQQRLK